MEAIALNKISIDGLPAGRIVDFSLLTHANQHGRCHAVIELTSELPMDELLKWQDKEVRVYTDKICLFMGRVTDAYWKTKSRYSLLTIDLISGSASMDIKKNSRTFQAVDKKLSDVVRKIVEPYHANVQLAEDFVISQMLYQNNETDWDFLCRLCESTGRMIFADCSSPILQISIGFKPFFSRCLYPEDCQHGCHVSFVEVFRRQVNTCPASRVDEFMDVKVVTNDITLSAGYGVKMSNHEQAVLASRLQAKGDMLENELLIRHKEGLVATAFCQKKRWHAPCYLPGKVMAVQGQMVKMHFDCDAQQDEKEARWIPHENTVNNYMYSMPDIGDRAFVYFEECGELLVLGSHRGDLGGNPDYQTPENRNLTSENSMIQFQPDSTTCVAGRDGEQTSGITEDTQNGISIYSTETILLQTPQKICIESGADEQTDEGAELADGFDRGYKEYITDGGAPLSALYTLKNGEKLGVDSDKLCDDSPAFEDVVKSQTAAACDTNKGGGE